MAEFTEVMKQKNRMCWNGTFNQNDCPLFKEVSEEICNVDLCNTWIGEHPQEAEEIIMNWAKEHPAKTNADKFKEVFGIEVDNHGTCSAGIKCQADYGGCINCEYNGFWDKEYMEPKEV